MLGGIIVGRDHDIRFEGSNFLACHISRTVYRFGFTVSLGIHVELFKFNLFAFQAGFQSLFDAITPFITGMVRVDKQESFYFQGIVQLLLCPTGRKEKQLPAVSQ